MQNFQFAQIFTERRKELQVTQEQIAHYVGVSRAAVSKWEKGLSYPDITLLPKLATYFNVSIDLLLGYEPQMTKERIMSTYATFAIRLGNEPFEQVDQQIDEMLAEYYSCFPFLLKIAQLYMNYYPKSTNPDQILEKCLTLCERIKTQSHHYQLSNEAKILEAYIYIMQGKPEQVLELLGEEAVVQYGSEQLIATAHTMLGAQHKAKEVLQVSMYQQTVGLISNATETLLLEIDHSAYFEETIKRTQQLLDTFQIANLNPNIALVFYIKAAGGYMMKDQTEQALQMIERYTKVCSTLKFPLELTGDSYFYKLGQWIDQQERIDKQAPRDNLSIKKDLVASVTNYPLFSALQDNAQFKIIMTNLQNHLQLEEEL
ncbi:transcriptional regulator [Solibacillus sp. R5-41]|uniref:helix-turn-helix domain-containing protein n=1 Tax=Solibacillus sp. R5-41 TaxID=2048654 RepID=UPI000C124BA7|nr:helix-turn-helix transcriptional regulator [Solibacillus sp. R5-41]ATP38672.1 transcriptional regulator [Solibacillus sp. R5-41]